MALGFEDGEIYVWMQISVPPMKSKVKIIAYISNLIILSLDYSFGHNKEAS